MSKIYVISHDFKWSTDYYPSFFAELEGFKAWWHFIHDTWLVETELNAEEIFEKLKPTIDDDMNLLIVEVGTDFSGRLPKKAWDWINEHLKKSEESNLLEAASV